MSGTVVLSGSRGRLSTVRLGSSLVPVQSFGENVWTAIKSSSISLSSLLELDVSTTGVYIYIRNYNDCSTNNLRIII